MEGGGKHLLILMGAAVSPLMVVPRRTPQKVRSATCQVGFNSGGRRPVHQQYPQTLVASSGAVAYPHLGCREGTSVGCQTSEIVVSGRRQKFLDRRMWFSCKDGIGRMPRRCTYGKRTGPQSRIVLTPLMRVMAFFTSCNES